MFLIYQKIQSGAVAKSYMMKGFLIYEEMRKYFPILVGFGLACAPVRCAHPSFLDSLLRPTGRCAPPPPPIAASLIIPVILWGPNYVPVRP
jgi:hypothetical protein